MGNKTNHPLGYLAFLLHGHLPYVKNSTNETSLEEKWLFEAITESYIPLLMAWERLAQEGIPFQLTFSLSPTLISMLIDPELPERYGRFLTNQLELAEKEIERTKNNQTFRKVVHFYQQRLSQIDYFYKEKYQYNLIEPFARLAKAGYLELITTSATHGFLPLLLTDEARRAQIRTGIQTFQNVFGWSPSGIWLPECGYLPGIDELLKEEGIGYFIMSGHGFQNCVPKNSKGIYAPVKCPSGVAVFGRDYETSQQVWSRSEGYPGDFDYREFYRDIGYDLDYAEVAPYLPAGIRGDTGFKYYRITGKTEAKEVYHPEVARNRAREHAKDFVKNRNWQVEYWNKQISAKPIITAPYDAELFGHWWFEGPDWIEDVLRIAAEPENSIQTIGFSNYLKLFPPQETHSFAPSSWGEGGYYRYWLNNQNDWTYPYLHTAEKTMIRLVENSSGLNEIEKRALNQAGRELLLAQSSDWPFIMTSQTVVDYATRRLQEHLKNFFRLCNLIQGNLIQGNLIQGNLIQGNLIQGELLQDDLIQADLIQGDLIHANPFSEKDIERLEKESPIFSHFDYHCYQSRVSNAGFKPYIPFTKQSNVIMLSWEYPPQYVGGLGIHVRDLAETLVRQGTNVTVITVAHHGDEGMIQRNGVNIIFLPAYQKLDQEIDFISWIFQLNLRMADCGRDLLMTLKDKNVVIHAHDWLVSLAASELQHTFDLPLITTIHATESGRNRGLHNSIQQSIHMLEKRLVQVSDQLICCSQYMKGEIKRLFNTSKEINVIPNAVNPIVLPKRSRKRRKGKNILFFGRLVPEKGVQHLLEAVSGLLGIYPEIKVTIAGSGPYLYELENLSRQLGIENIVQFLGFVTEDVRNQLLAQADLAVFPSLYEPFGLVALEAMSAGVPVIAADTGGLAETVKNEVNGLKFKPGDIRELQGCLVRILKNPDLADTLSRQSQLIVTREYTWEAVARQTSAVYQKEVLEVITNVS